jgi:carbonic anhydrase/acetyltransferase-like protein (isoleucine patch superfamily)
MKLMKNIISYKNKKPVIEEGTYINPYALVIGRVMVREGVSLWPGVIVRADDSPVELGKDTAVLDRALIEAPRDHPMTIGEKALISHGAILHGCTVGNGTLIGISANILDGVEVGDECVVAAGTLITPGMKIPSRSKVMGTPAKVTGTVTEQDLVRVSLEHASIIKKAKEYGTWFVAKETI